VGVVLGELVGDDEGELDGDDDGELDGEALGEALGSAAAAPAVRGSALALNPAATTGIQNLFMFVCAFMPPLPG
jgi:hypothetical protein